MADATARKCVFVSSRGDQWALGAGGSSPLVKASNAVVQHLLFLPESTVDAEIIAKTADNRFIVVTVLTTGAFRELEFSEEEIAARIKELEAKVNEAQQPAAAE